MDPRVLAGVRLALAELSNAELAVFGMCLGWPDAKTQAARRPWFTAVAHLFTDGERLHEETQACVCQIIVERLP